MADTKISALTELAVAPDFNDELVIVDKSDTAMAATGTDKKIQVGNLSRNLIIVTQTAHGFVVGNVLRFNGTAYAKAQADSVTNAEVVGMVASVTDANTFVLQMNGRITGLSSLTSGGVYFLSPTTAGGLTSTEPITLGQVSKPLLVAISSTAGIMLNMRGIIVPYATRVFLPIIGPTATLTTGDGQQYFRVDSSLNGKNLVSVAASLVTASSSGIPTVQLRRVRGGANADMLTTKLTIDATEVDSITAAAAAVIDTANDDVATADQIFVDVDVAGTGAKGLGVFMGFGG